MRIRFPKLLAIAVCLVFAPAHATSNHHYGKNEYAVIRHGLAPDKQTSLASHGAGELGDDDFHVWLMSEPAHRKIAALDNISADNNLDTDADAYHAFWSQDSRHVGVAFRSDRHEVTLNLYRVENRRAHLMTGPDLFKEVAHRDVADEDDLRDVNAIVEWHDGNRFTRRELRSFVVSDDKLVKLLGPYGRIAEKLDGGKLFVQSSVDAECEAVGDDYKIVSLRPGKPADADTWWDK